MIKFFRNIRLRLLSEDKTSKYLKYAVGEIALVVIGILIALSINNWNSRITDNKNEALYLKRIKIDVAQQIDVLKTISGFCEFETSLADSILREYKTQKDLRNINELHKRLSSLMYTIGINKANTTFNELSSTGQLNLIKST